MKKENKFIIAYVIGLTCLAGVGYYCADFTIKAEQHAAETKKQKFATDVAYVELPRMNITLVAAHAQTTGRVRMDISLAVEKQYEGRLEGYQPRISDRIVSFTRKLDFDQMSQPRMMTWLHKKLLEEVNIAASPLPVMDVVFREFVVL